MFNPLISEREKHLKLGVTVVETIGAATVVLGAAAKAPRVAQALQNAGRRSLIDGTIQAASHSAESLKTIKFINYLEEENLLTQSGKIIQRTKQPLEAAGIRTPVNTRIAAFKEIEEKVGMTFEFINLGGGIGIPYKPGDNHVSYSALAAGIKNAYDGIIAKSSLAPVRIFTECGRVITGPYGYLVVKAIHMKHTYRNFVGTDACMANLMRPAMYGAYHHITVLGKESMSNSHVYDVTGSLCENNDKFAINRSLPEINIGDILVIHDTGAHGFAMGFNYNGKLRSAELLLRPDGSVLQIRRAETVDDYFATLDFDGLKTFN